MIEIDFKTALNQVGIHTKEAIKADGVIHRIHVKGDSKGSKNGWYVLYDGDIPAGAFGSWKTGEQHTWCSKGSHELTTAQRQQHAQRMREAQQAREAEELGRRQAAQVRANTIWKAAPIASPEHPYLVKKSVNGFGLRQHNGALVIPMLDSAGVIHSLQFIDDVGNKRFLSGGRKKGSFFPIGTEQPMDSLYVCEGYATGASIYGVTQCYTAVAFDAGNLLPVARALRAAHPHADITICADNDADKPINAGVVKAREAAFAVDAYIAYPEQAGDFNDAITGAHK